MQEAFVIVKYGASFQVIHDALNIQIRSLTSGNLSPSVCKFVALSQRSIARFYVATQQGKGNASSDLTVHFKKKGWQVRKQKIAALV